MKLLLALALISIAGGRGAAPPISDEPSRIISFGDSYVDNDASNGPPALEQLATLMGLPVTNLGVGGSTAAQQRTAINNYLAGSPDLDGAVYWWNEGNEFNACFPSCASQIAASANQFRLGVQALQAAGYTDIWVMSIVDVGMTPGAISGGIVAQANQLSRDYRDAVNDATDDLGINFVDMYEFWRLGSTTSHFSNITQACGACGAPDTYMWWDATHPTEEMHGLVAAMLQGLR